MARTARITATPRTAAQTQELKRLQTELARARAELAQRTAELRKASSVLEKLRQEYAELVQRMAAARAARDAPRAAYVAAVQHLRDLKAKRDAVWERLSTGSAEESRPQQPSPLEAWQRLRPKAKPKPSGSRRLSRTPA